MDQRTTHVTGTSDRSPAPLLALQTHGGSDFLVEMLVRRLTEAQPAGEAPPTDQETEALVQALQFHVNATAEALRGREEARDGSRHLLPMLRALIAAVPAAGAGRPVREVTARLPLISREPLLGLHPASE